MDSCLKVLFFVQQPILWIAHMKGFVISATSDIATEVIVHWKKRGWDLYGTSLSKGENHTRLLLEKVPLFPLDLSNLHSIDHLLSEIPPWIEGWDFVLFATDSQKPVGLFTQVDIEEWCRSIEWNFLHQMRVLHRLLPLRNQNSSSVLFFAGVETNHAVGHSAYTLSKIALIKACALLDLEIPNLKFSII